MRAIAKYTFFNYLFWFFVGNLVTRFMELINFTKAGTWLELEDLADMFSSFLSSMRSTNGSQKGEIRFSQKSLTKGIAICIANDHIFNEGISKIFEFTSVLNFISSVIKSCKLWPSSCLRTWKIYGGEWWHFSLGCSTQKIYSKQVLMSFDHQLNRR